MTTSGAVPSRYFQVYIIGLPRDSRIPRRRRQEGTSVSTESIRRLLPAAVERPPSDEESEIWFRWVIGHQHLFLYWMVQGDLCQRIDRAVQAGKAERVARLLNHLTVLRWGEIAAMLNCGNLPSPLYQAILRPRMEKVRADFSARSAQDYLVMETAMTALRKTLRRLPRSDDFLGRAVRGFNQACSRWKEHHIEVAERLQPGVSLAVMEYQRLRDQGIAMSFPQYVDNVIQSGEAMAQYDCFFGVERADMDLEEFAQTALWVLGQIHRILALPREQLKWVLRGDHLLVAYLDRLLRVRERTSVS